MPKYCELETPQLSALLDGLKEEYKKIQAAGLKLDMSRGKPGADQLDLSAGLLSALDNPFSEDGMDCRNYGMLEGLPETRRLMAPLLDVPAENVFVGGNSSLSLMYETLSFAIIHGLPESTQPWGKAENVKFLCPAPGYDRHFNMTEDFGCELITVPMTPEGPDMDAVEQAVKNDPAVKGIWCVPKYSNPQGITYSDATVRRFAALEPAAKDFRIFWDNAYSVHALDIDNPDILLSLYHELIKTGKENMAFIFTSMSKITFSGAGLSAVGMSGENLNWFMKRQFYRTIGNDKLTQLRHARFLPDYDSVIKHMRGHAEILAPKFKATLDSLAALGEEGLAAWAVPHGGYFISLDVLPGCAKRTVQLCKEAGVALTPAGATYPYGNDPEDKNIRIAPTFPPISELLEAAKLLRLCVRIAGAEKLLSQR